MAERAYMLKSQRQDWGTPKDLFDALDAEFGPFDLDPCGQREHHYSAWKIESRGGHFYDGSCEAMDGLVQPWHGKVFMNPVYGEPEHPCRPKCRKKRCPERGYHITEYVPGMADWVERAVGEVARDNAELCLGLLPARTDTKWWQKHVLRSYAAHFANDPTMTTTKGADYLWEVRFLPGRVKFVGAENSAPFPSAVVVWKR